MTTVLSLIFLKLLEEYCKHYNHKKLRLTISAIRLIIKYLDGGLSESILEIIFQTIKGLK